MCISRLEALFWSFPMTVSFLPFTLYLVTLTTCLQHVTKTKKKKITHTKKHKKTPNLIFLCLVFQPFFSSEFACLFSQTFCLTAKKRNFPFHFSSSVLQLFVPYHRLPLSSSPFHISLLTLSWLPSSITQG